MLHCISIIACMQGNIAHDTIICYNGGCFFDYDYRGTRQETDRWYRESFNFLITMRSGIAGFLQQRTLDHLWIITILAFIWFFLSIMPLPPNDLWWHMAAGRAMVDETTVIDTNRWAYTLPTETPYQYQSWLSEILLYGLWWLGNVPLLTLARTVVVTASYGLVAWLAWRTTRQGKAVALALLLAALIGWNNWTLRPQTLALLPGATFIVVLGGYRVGLMSARWLLLLPLMMMLWVNGHGSFLLGVGLVGLSWR